MKTYFINGTMGDVKYFIDDLAEFQIQEIDSDSLNRYIYPGDTINYALDSYYNQRGAKVYINVDCQPLLPLQEGRNKYLVLSVGVEKRGVPLATIFENGNPICYRLPDEYYEWALTVVGMANSGEKFFPEEVVFSLVDGRYYVDIL